MKTNAYHEVNKSDIFFTQNSSNFNNTNSVLDKENLKQKINGNSFNRVLNQDIQSKYSNKKKSQSVITDKNSKTNFIPKYKEETNFKRKLKELYPNGELDQVISVPERKNISTSFGAFKKEVYNVGVRKSFDENFSKSNQKLKHLNTSLNENKNIDHNEIIPLNPREKRLRDLNPDLKVSEIKNLAKTRRSASLSENLHEGNFKIENNLNKSTNHTDIQNNPKITKIQNLQSNIFHNNISVKKYRNNIPTQNFNKSEKKLVTLNSQLEKRNNVKRTICSESLDWSKTNTEILFNDNSNKKEYSPAKRKMQILMGTSNFEMKEASKSFNNYNKDNLNKNNNNINFNESLEIQSKIQERFNHQDAKIKKNNEQLSTLHNSDFYNNALNVSNLDRSVSLYEIENIQDDFKLKEFKSSFAQKGIHVYDVNLEGDRVLNANTKLSFKVRNNENDPKFNHKFEELNEGIKANGMEIKMKSLKDNFKPNGNDTVPSDLKWDDPNLPKILKNKSGINKVIEETKIKIKPDEKYSNYKQECNLLYKNRFIKEAEVKNKSRSLAKYSSPVKKVEKSTISIGKTLVSAKTNKFVKSSTNNIPKIKK